MVKNNPRISAPKLTSGMWERFGKKLNPETAKMLLEKQGTMAELQETSHIYKRSEQKEETSMRKRIR